MNDAQRKALIDAAQDTLRDDRHWSVVDMADRAANGDALAEMILQFLDVEQDDCPTDCQKCKAHRANTGEE